MKIERNRAARRAAHTARRYHVSPVARAIRSVLTVSAAALAFSGTGLAIAKTPAAPAAIAAPRATLADQALHQIPATVVDLTVVHDASLPTSVVDGAFDLHAALADPESQLAANGPGDGGRLDRVRDLTTVPMLAPGPGDGTSGTTNDVGYNITAPGAGYQWWTLNSGFSYSANSPDGYAVGFFGTADSMRIDSHWDIDVVGYSWAAGIEVESLLGDTIINQDDTIDATATGAGGTAVGVYGYAAGATTIGNSGAIVASATGVGGTALGLFAYAVAGDATASNLGGTIDASADGGALGLVANSVYGDAITINNGNVHVTGDIAIGLASLAGNGDALAYSNGDVHAYGNTEAVAVMAQSYGNAFAQNTGLAVAVANGDAIGVFAIADGTATAFNMGDVQAISYYGDAQGLSAVGDSAMASNDAYGSVLAIGATATGLNAEGVASASAVNRGDVDVEGLYAGVGMNASASGFAQSINHGDISVYAYDGSATGVSADSDGEARAYNLGTVKVDGVQAYGVVAHSGNARALADNSGTVNAFGFDSAYGVLAISDSNVALAQNSGEVTADANGSFAAGLAAISGDMAVATNNDTVIATANNGVGIGVLAVGNFAHANNSEYASITATGYVAAGLDAEGYSGAVIDNDGDVVVDGTALAFGAYAVSVAGSASALNFGSMDVNAVGDAYGLYAVALGTGAGTLNDGRIDVTSQYGNATGMFAVGVGGVSITNGSYGDIVADGAAASGILAFGAGEGAQAYVRNSGDISATGDTFASGIEAVSRAYLGTAIVVNTGDVHATALDGDVQGIVAAADRDAQVVNGGMLVVEGGTSAYAVLALSADGNVVVDNTYGDIYAYANSRDGIAYGIAAQSNNGLVDIDNGGMLVAIGDNATGIYAGTKWNDVDVDNNGFMQVFANNGAAMGIQTLTYTGSSSITNSGTLYVGGAYSGVGAWSISLEGDAEVVNNGLVHASGGALARGLMARTVYAGTASIENGAAVRVYSGASSYGAWARSDSGAAEVANHGAITVGSVFGYGYGVISGGALGSDVTNDGSIYAYGGYSGGGVLAYSAGGNVHVTNDGDITGVSYYNASGIIASAAGDVEVTNNGFAGAYAFADNAFGIDAGAGGDVRVTNDGTIVAETVHGSVADGIFAGGTHVVVDNTGTIDVSAYNWAAGIEAIGDVSVDARNHGSITATAHDGMASGIFAYGYDAATVLNAGDIAANADFGYAMGMAAYSYGTAKATNCDCGTIDSHVGSGYAYGLLVQGNQGIVVNDGVVNAIADNGYATGIEAFGYTSVDIANGATGGIHAISHNGDATGIFARGGAVAIGNAGDVTAEGTEFAAGIVANGLFDGSSINIDNSGAVHAAVGGEKYGLAAGILAQTEGDIDIANTGAITATGGVVSFGVMAHSGYGNTHVAQGGDITVEALAMGAGIMVGGKYGPIDGDISIVGDGNTTVSAGKYGVGIVATTYAGDVNIDVGGHTDVYAYGMAVGIGAMSVDGNASVTHAGAITVATGDYGNATGIRASAYAGGQASIVNSGSVSVSTLYGEGIGLYGEGDVVDIANSGDVVVEGGTIAIGVGAYAGASATIVNDGHVTVTQTGASVYSGEPTLVVEDGNAIGLGAYVGQGNVSITNDGSVDVTAFDSATGVQAYATDGAIVIANAGHVGANAENGDAVGIDAVARHDYAATSVRVTNDGDIVATSSHHAAEGIWALGNTIDVHSTGSITATGYGFAAGIEASGDDVSIINDGAIHATLTGGGEYTGAVGIYTYGAASMSVANGGDIVVEAALAGAYGIVAYSYVNAVSVANSGSIAATGGYSASGIEAITHGDVSIDNSGDVLVGGPLAIGVLAEGDALHVANTGHVAVTAVDNAAGVALLGAMSDFANGGSITATASADAGVASGVVLMTPEGVAAHNDGDILAVSHGHAVGVSATSVGDITIGNTGTIEASGPSAIALDLAGDAGISIVNSGLLLADGASESSWAIVGDAALVDVHNAGDMVGAVRFAGGNDSLANDGTWIVRGNGTDFGGGDDRLVNGADGTIVLENASISLGANTALGNAFDNAGTIAVLGDSFIDMGTGLETIVAAANAAPIDVLNPAAFHNAGVITFLDGAPDDVLTIAGDFAGEGAINLDVSMLNGTSDMLYVDGNVVDGTVQALNVNVLDMPNTSGDIDVPVVLVAGDSQAGQFIAGTFTVGDVVFSQSNFLDLGVDVVHADAEAGDMFALQLTFDGINDNGSLAASIAPGAQSLMAAQVGTFRQRMGVFTQLGNSGKGAWVRVFADKGTIDPDAVMDNLPQGGNFAFDQTNTGIEAGYNVLVTDGVFLGASLASGEGDQSLDGGIGSDEIDGDTIGAHATWIGTNGMYADLSYRWMHFDAELLSGGGRQAVGGDAGALNLEAGWNVWSSGGGLKLVPQLQYTRTTVDNIDPVRGDLADFVTDGTTSSRLRAGLEFQQTFTTEKGNWTPYGTISAIREFDGESRFSIADTFTGRTSTEGTSGMLELGANVNMGRMNLWGGISWIDGGAVDSVFGGQVGLRYTW